MNERASTILRRKSTSWYGTRRNTINCPNCRSILRINRCYKWRWKRYCTPSIISCCTQSTCTITTCYNSRYITSTWFQNTRIIINIAPNISFNSVINCNIKVSFLCVNYQSIIINIVPSFAHR